MDFFKAQDYAKRRTRRLVIMFAISLLGLLALTNLLLYLIFNVSSASTGTAADAIGLQFYGAVSAAVLLVVLLSSLFKTLSLRQGGDAVAQMMNARLLVSSSSVEEQRLLNIVEEMAIASGSAVPPVYIMEELSINAFAAGHSTEDAVIGVTRGAIQKLNREQLQGVIAHEFSHILHGDMRLNLRLIGLLHGIMVLGMMGHYLLRAASASRRDKDNAAIAIVGIGLLVIGASGTFFGGLIKAAVSRQREFLADASAVQYTRNPAGIAGALKRISIDTGDHYLINPAASQISHALFTEGVKHRFNALFATHPPLEKRIIALDPQWDGQFVAATPALRSTISPKSAATFAVSRAGMADEEDIVEARRIIQNMPVEYLHAAKEPFGAAAIVCLLMLKQDFDANAEQSRIIDQRLGRIDKSLAAEATRLCRIHTMPAPETRLAIINICLSSLRQLTVTQYKEIRTVWQKMIKTDPQPDLQSWLVFQLTTSHLDRILGYHSQKEMSAQTQHLQHDRALSIFMSVLTYSSGASGVGAEMAFRSAANLLSGTGIVLIPADQLSLAGFKAAANQLKLLTAADKKRLLEAMVDCVYHDNKVTVTENELMRTMSEILGCPLPARF
jgi:Zn-dependent protease with chaperone function